jgi:uncharacterized membrane protein
VITLEFIYVLMGLLLVGIAIVNLRDARQAKRYTNALFWGIYAATFLFGSYLPAFVSGCLVIAMVVVVSVRGIGRGEEDTTREEREASARRWRNTLFVPALIIPTVTLVGTLTLKSVRVSGVPLVDPRQITLISLGFATLIALAVGMALLEAPILAPISEARRLMDSVGWAAVLPQMLAALGAVFAVAGVGTVIATLANRWIPLDTAIAAVITYAVGMAVFTMIMGNAFAAFPVMTAAVGLPLVVTRFGGNPAIVAAIGMLAGYSGTLITPMAANFNIVPAALLDLSDQHAVIRVQAPTAILLLITNTLLMYILAFRF